MSHPVELEELAVALDRYGNHAFLLTTSDDLRPHISHVTLPAGSKSAITDRDFTIATVVAPSGMKSAEGDTTKAEGEA